MDNMNVGNTCFLNLEKSLEDSYNNNLGVAWPLGKQFHMFQSCIGRLVKIIFLGFLFRGLRDFSRGL